MICWSCEKSAGDGVTCASCGAVLPPDPRADHFQVLGAERRFAVDLEALERRYKDLTRLLHPDRFARADARARRASLARTVQLNDAWRTLRDPVRRAEYLLRLHGIEVGSEEGTSRHTAAGGKERIPVPPALLMEVLELREGLAEARAARDQARVTAMSALVRARRDQEMKTVAAALESGDQAAAAAALVAVRYHDRFLEEALAGEAGRGPMPVEALFDISEPGESRAKEACRTGRAVGIDLGTTNSLVAAVEAGQPVCLRDEQGAIVPSVVHYAAGGGVVVGEEARRLAPQHPSDTIASVKRFMGRGPADAEATRRLTPYRFASVGPTDGVVRFAVAGRQVTPIEVSAEILRVLRARAEAQLGAPLDGAVITVPAYFDDGQRQATRDAGRLAGLEVLRLLNEPTAAALAYGLDKQAEGTFAVFDLGGGTFDISILKLERGVFEVKTTGGDSALGGDDFDRAIAGRLLALMGLPEDGGGDRFLVRRALDAARAAKEALTDAEETILQLARPDGSRWSGRLSRAEVEALVRPVLERCGPPVRRALKDGGLQPADLAGVILVGGATRMPLVRRFVRELFGREPLADIDPDEVVALGAAIQADVLAGSGRDDVVLMDVVPLSLGLEMMGGVVEKLVHRNTTVPCGATQTFTTYADNQTGFDLHVLQGERELVSDCRSLARFKLGGIPPMPAGMARLEVTFVVDADGILRVAAREQVTGQESSIEVKPSYGLSDEEVERMLLDSFAHGAEDVKARQLAEQRVEAERILAATRAALAATPELATADDRRAIDDAARALEAAQAGSDSQAIRQAVEALDASSKAFAQRRMDRALAAGLRGRGVAEVEVKVDETSLRAHVHPSPARRA